MYFIRVLLFFFILITTVYAQSWRWQNGETGSSSYSGMCKTGNNSYILYGPTGLLKKTTDNGASWFSISAGSSVSFQKMFFLNSSLGWGYTSSGSVYKTTDGGENWISTAYLGTSSVPAITFADSLNGWIAGTYLYRTTNGGLNWNTYSSFPLYDYSISSMSFLDSNTGVFAGSFYYNGYTRTFCAVTTNGGQNWEIDTLKNSSSFRKVVIVSKTNWWVFTQNYLYTTTDAGMTWAQKTNPEPNYSTDAAAVNTLTGWVLSGSNNRVSKTTDGGSTWKSTNLPPTSYSAFAVVFFNESEGFTINQYGPHAKTTDGGLTWTVYQPVSVYSGDLTDIFFVDDNNGWALGSQYTLLSTTNGGINWNKLPYTFPTIIKSVKFLTKNIGYVLSSYSIYRTSDGGNTWTANQISSSYSSYAMHTTDGGVSWISKQTGSYYGFYCLTFVNSKTAYAGGENGYIYKTTDGGTSWVNKSTNSSNTIIKLSFISGDTGFACSSYGYIYKTTNGGTNWSLQSLGSSEYLRSIGFSSKTDGWIIGDYGSIYKTTNCGVNWNRVNFISTQTLYGLALVNERVWICGSSGLIISNVQPFLSSTAGYVLVPGSVRKLEWYKRGTGTYNIDYSTNSGQAWIPIATGVPDSQQYYSWQVPNTLSTKCKLRFSDQNGILFTSENLFSIATLNISVTQPIDSVRAGSKLSVSWSGTANTPLNINFSADSGKSWMNVASSISFAEGSYSLTVPFIGSKTCKIMLSPVSDPKTSVVSDVTFPVYLFHLSSTVGLSLRAGNPYYISWNASYKTPVNIFFSTDKGITWQDVATNVHQDSSSYKWRIPRQVSSNCKFKITDNKNTTEISDSTFRIYYSPIALYNLVYPNPILPSFGEILVSASGSLAMTPKVTVNIQDTIKMRVIDTANSWYSGSVKFDSAGIYTIITRILTKTDYEQDTVREFSVNFISRQMPTTALSVDSKAALYLPAGSCKSPGMVMSSTMETASLPVYEFSSSAVLADKGSLEIAYDAKTVSNPEYLSIAKVDEVGNCIAIPSVVLSNKNCLQASVTEFGKYTLIKSEQTLSRKIPTQYTLYQNYPNPFNPSTRISFSTPETGRVSLYIYDILGRHIRTLVTENLNPGFHEVKWDGTNAGGNNVACGVYICTMRTAHSSSSIKMLYIK
ncbi:MAG: hypothetical protein HYV28_10505 [Ignavibacteriales bacterium]|nr:hypothetical protein [Ignavibacteriales bacterium]